MTPIFPVFGRVSGLSALMAGLCLAGAATSALASTIVVFNPDTNHKTPVTKTFPDADPVIQVAAGDEAVVYYGNQSMERVTGPFAGRVSQAHRAAVDGNSLFGRIAAVFVTADQRTGNIGAARGAPVAAAIAIPPGVDALDINLDTSEPQCYLNIPLHVWQSAPATGDVILSNIGGAAARLELSGNGAQGTWPKGVGIAEDGQYVVSRLGAPGRTHVFTLKSLAVDNPENVSVADLVAAGCDFQAAIKAQLLLRAQR